MTRNDFELIARALFRSGPNAHDETISIEARAHREIQWQQTVNAIADMLSEQNARFDRAKFRNACDVA
jgi:hypothetical protein